MITANVPPIGREVRSPRALRILALALVALGPASVTGQTVTGTILGTIRDATGAVVTDSAVTLKHEGTGATRTVSTDSLGAYAAPLLATGTYRVSAEAAGFKRASIAGVTSRVLALCRS